jgi:hypothetical protein
LQLFLSNIFYVLRGTMASFRMLLAGLASCIMLAGCNPSGHKPHPGETTGTFDSCAIGTLVDGKCIVTPSVVTAGCQKGTLADGRCVVTPDVVTGECTQGSLVDGKCIVTPSVVTAECQKGTLADGKCVVTPEVVIRCQRGTLVDGRCLETASVTDPVDRDDGMRALNWNGSYATITTAEPASALRNYQLTTTQTQRKSGRSKQLQIMELASGPRIRTGSQLFDGLFAMAIQESRELTVTSIKDGKYRNGEPILCGGTVGCFQSGDEWTYVWTRDTAYAVDLGLAQINPQAARNSLMFKVSERRDSTRILGPETTEIVQDTGSGGSWPISTDRVVWARAAFELLKYLDGDERTKFLKDAYTAIRNTIESDRLAAFDERDGLYRGETSFLDWRAQTYPSWMVPNLVHIAMSKTLSTNLNHWKILDVAAKMANELEEKPDENRYRGWANELKQQIKSNLWLDEPGLFSMMKSTELDQSPVHRFELLGEALAITDGIADEMQAKKILKNYPHTSAGAAVVWPQMKDVQVYHNKAIWPFVSSYLIKAAKGRNADVVNRNFETLMRGASLHLSNMENFQFDDLAANTPAINSTKQLWSVGGYIGSVLDVVFGREADMTGIRFKPFITTKMHKDIFNGARQLQLNNLDYRSRKILVKVNLPDAGVSTTGSYAVQTVMLNGAQIPPERYTKASDLKSDGTNIFVVELIPSTAESDKATVVSADSDLYGPEPVDLTLSSHSWLLAKNGDGFININWKTPNPAGTAINIYRNGVSVATGVTDTGWTDKLDPITNQALCYTLERQYTSGLKNVSQRTNPTCYWGESNDRLVFIEANRATNKSGPGSKAERKLDHHRTSWSDWGVPGDELTFAFTAPATGDYDILLQYGNAFGGNTGGGNSIESGITAAVKKVVVRGPSATATGVLAMPQRESWSDWGESTPLRARLIQGGSYDLEISDYYNMSYLASNAHLNGDGGSQILNRANISGIMLRRRSD